MNMGGVIKGSCLFININTMYKYFADKLKAEVKSFIPLQQF